MRNWLLLVAGLLAGVAAGLLIGGLREDGDEAGGDAADRARMSRTHHGSGAGGLVGGSRSDRERRGLRVGGNGHSAPARIEDLMNYLTSLADVDDFEEVNLMALLRHGHFVTQMTEPEVASLLEKLRAEPGYGEDLREFHEVFTALLFARMAELNGPEAMRMAIAGELGPHFEDDAEELIAIGMASWVDADPEGAAAWFRQESGGDSQFQEALAEGDVQQAFFAAMARHDTTMAIELLREQGEEAVEGNMEVVARYEKTVEGLERILADTSGGAQREVFEVMSNRDPRAAARWIEAQSGLENRDDYMFLVGRAMLEAETEHAVDWYMGQELSDRGQAQRYEHIVDHLAADDPGGAGRWLAAQPDSPSRDLAEASLALRWSYDDRYEESFRWVNDIADHAQRLETADAIISRGWEHNAQRLEPELDRAAREAGYGAQVDAYVESRADRSRNAR